MTNAKETIIKSALKYLVKRQIAEGSVGFAVDNDHDHDCCWDDVLAWIEAQPSEDCISRQAVLDVINFEDKWLFDANGHNANTHIAFNGLESRVKALPPVTPERPKGKWIKIQSGDEDFPESIVCSRCKNENSHLDFDEHNNVIGKVFVTSKYCPNCGAEMSGGGEDG